MKRLFISYAHEDKALAKHIVEMLQAGGCDPWFDHKLVAGYLWDQQLQDEIRGCDVFVYVLTPHSAKSEWCYWEFCEAVKMGKAIVPVMLRKAPLNEYLNRIQHVDLTGHNEAREVAIAKLIWAVQAASPILTRADIPLFPSKPKGMPEYSRDKTVTHEFEETSPFALKESANPEPKAQPTDENAPQEPPPQARMHRKVIWWSAVGLIILVTALALHSLMFPPAPAPNVVILSQVPTALAQLATSTATGTIPAAVTSAAQPSATEHELPSPTPTSIPPSTTLTATPVPTNTPPVTLDAGQVISKPATIQGTVNVTSVYLRTGPGTTYASKGSAVAGDQFDVIGQSPNGWLLVEDVQGRRAWIASNLVTVSTVMSLVPLVATVPATPQGAVSAASGAQTCHPGEWNAGCGSNSCGPEDVSECNAQGTGFICHWDPTQCGTGGGVSIFSVPVVPTGEAPFKCTQGWLNGQIAAYGQSQNPPLSLQQTKQLLISQGYDHNQNGDIDCDDYRAVTGQG